MGVILLMRRKRNFTTVAAGPILAVFFAVLCMSAQSQGNQQQAVPNNPVVPTPPVQPIPFSHKTHLALDLQCQICHTNPEPGVLMTFPATDTCMGCHTTVATKKPAIVKLTEFAKLQKPIPWVRVYSITAGVQWSHRKHLEAGTKCVTCHGPVEDLDAMAVVTSVTAMGTCIHCHQMNNAKTACSTCHLWP
jgi:cytochrome c3-like protein